MQKGVGDKAVNQLEKSVNSKLEVTVARQIQAQFQTSAKQYLQVRLYSRTLVLQESTLFDVLSPKFIVSFPVFFPKDSTCFQYSTVLLRFLSILLLYRMG